MLVLLPTEQRLLKVGRTPHPNKNIYANRQQATLSMGMCKPHLGSRLVEYPLWLYGRVSESFGVAVASKSNMQQSLLVILVNTERRKGGRTHRTHPRMFKPHLIPKFIKNDSFTAAKRQFAKVLNKNCIGLCHLWLIYDIFRSVSDLFLDSNKPLKL